MAGHAHELETWLKPRGWTMTKGNNGHFKLWHEKCPHPLSASGSPSGLALKKIQSVVERWERIYGIAAPLTGKGGRPATEPFKVEVSGDTVTHTATCSECGTTTKMSSGTQSSTTPAHIAKRIRDSGWKIKTRRCDDLCPSCRKDDPGSKEKPDFEIREAVPVSLIELPRIKLPPPKPQPIAAINVEALTRQQLAQKRKIAALLSKLYLADLGYLPNESDETVALKAGTSKELVEIVRRDFYGPPKKLLPLAMVKRAVHGYRRDLKAFEEDMLDKVAKLDSDAGAILKWLDMLDENILPEQKAPADEPELPMPGLMNGHGEKVA